MWDDLRDWWDSDQVWRSQIMLAVIVGAIGFTWVILELTARRKLGAPRG